MGRRPGGKIPVPPKADLERLYITENKTQRQMADIYKVSKSCMQRWLEELEIKKRPGMAQQAMSDDEYIKLFEDFTYSGETLAKYGARLDLSAKALWARVRVGENLYRARKRANRKESVVDGWTGQTTK